MNFVEKIERRRREEIPLFSTLNLFPFSVGRMTHSTMNSELTSFCPRRLFVLSNFGNALREQLRTGSGPEKRILTVERPVLSVENTFSVHALVETTQNIVEIPTVQELMI